MFSSFFLERGGVVLGGGDNVILVCGYLSGEDALGAVTIKDSIKGLSKLIFDGGGGHLSGEDAGDDGVVLGGGGGG